MPLFLVWAAVALWLLEESIRIVVEFIDDITSGGLTKLFEVLRRVLRLTEAP